MTDLELKHYGVKGMRWGVRKDRDPNTRLNIKYEKGFYKKNIGTNRLTSDSYTDRQKNKIKKQALKTVNKAVNNQVDYYKTLMDYKHKNSEKVRKNETKLKNLRNKNVKDPDKEYLYKERISDGSYELRGLDHDTETVKSNLRYLNKLHNKISDNTIEAGKDYITNTTFTFLDKYSSKGKNYIHTFLKINGSDDVYDSFKTPGGFYKSAYLDDKKHKIKYKYDYTHDYRPY